MANTSGSWTIKTNQKQSQKRKRQGLLDVVSGIDRRSNETPIGTYVSPLPPLPAYSVIVRNPLILRFCGISLDFRYGLNGCRGRTSWWIIVYRGTVDWMLLEFEETEINRKGAVGRVNNFQPSSRWGGWQMSDLLWHGDDEETKFNCVSIEFCIELTSVLLMSYLGLTSGV